MTNFNARLPVALTPINRFSEDKYEVRLGNKSILTTSHAKLELGRTYWAEVSNNEAGQVIIKNLRQRPEILELATSLPLRLSISELIDFITISESPLKSMREFLDDTGLYMPLLADSLKEGVLSMAVSAPSPSILQISFNPLRIFAIVESYGALSLYRKGDVLYMSAIYPAVLSLAKRYLKIKGFSMVFNAVDDIAPLYSLASYKAR